MTRYVGPMFFELPADSQPDVESVAGLQHESDRPGRARSSSRMPPTSLASSRPTGR
jgi:hypothetical protein